MATECKSNVIYNSQTLNRATTDGLINRQLLQVFNRCTWYLHLAFIKIDTGNVRKFSWTFNSMSLQIRQMQGKKKNWTTGETGTDKKHEMLTYAKY